MTRGIGDNSGMSPAAVDRLKSFVDRAVNLDDEAEDIKADKAELFKEIVHEGFSAGTVRKIVRLRRNAKKIDKAVEAEKQALLELYLEATGYGDLL